MVSLHSWEFWNYCRRHCRIKSKKKNNVCSKQTSLSSCHFLSMLNLMSNLIFMHSVNQYWNSTIKQIPEKKLLYMDIVFKLFYSTSIDFLISLSDVTNWKANQKQFSTAQRFLQRKIKCPNIISTCETNDNDER